ncbi:hypothetical protein BGZ51_005637 [Haplosporangium sp. Z 767]|nr:hypothetical protein BGZ50_002620 [Haplosporangium sp. Z 11]KAF9192443.1 hypothetical protein BGZ51_005637 [Haplosporangium sp. Z 767]
MAVEISSNSSGEGSDGGKKAQFNFSLRSIVFSHFNEKARWALDYYQIPYIEHRYMPLCHMLSMFKYRSQGTPAPGCSNFATPFLMVTPKTADDPSGMNQDKNENKVTLNDSTAIVEFLSEQFATPHTNSLYSNDSAAKAKIMSLEDRFDTMLGPHVRRYFYNEILLHSPKAIGQSLGQHDNVGRLQAWVWMVFYSVFAWILVRFLRVNEISAARSKDIIKREFEHISRVLESGPPGPAYLVGNQFTTADMTLASLGGILVGVTNEDGYGAWVPRLTQLRPEAQAFCAELRAMTAGQHILECYKLHRGGKAPGSSYGYSFFGLW